MQDEREQQTPELVAAGFEVGSEHVTPFGNRFRVSGHDGRTMNIVWLLPDGERPGAVSYTLGYFSGSTKVLSALPQAAPQGKKHDTGKSALRLLPPSFLEADLGLPVLVVDVVRRWQAYLEDKRLDALSSLSLDALTAFQELGTIDGALRAMQYGLAKYSTPGTEDAEGSWRHVPNAVPRYLDAALRHALAIERGELLDPESGLAHADHLSACLLFLTELAP